MNESTREAQQVTVRRAAPIVVAIALFATMWIGYRLGWAWLDAVDDWALTRTLDAAGSNPAWVTFWDVLCTVFGPTVFRIIGVVVMVVAIARRNFRAALLVLLTVELSGIVTQTAKWLADRARPDGAMVHAFGTSFPSGHALAVAAVAVATVALVTRHRAAWTVGLIVMVLVVGFGRVALNVHHPSDVLAGWALGFAYAAVCVLVLRPEPLRYRSVSGADGRPEAPGTSR